MSKTALLTSGRKLSGNEGSFLLSVYDLEPAGIVVTAYNQVNSKEYSLPISEMEVSLIRIQNFIRFFFNDAEFV